MSVEITQGKPAPRTPRPGENAMTVETVLAGPYKDPATGRFVPGNKAARLRALKRTSQLVTLNAAECAPWARPFVEMAHDEARDLVVETGAESSTSLSGFACDAADAHAMYRACMAIALSAETDPSTAIDARSEARQWMREHRQSLLSLRAEARAGVPERGHEGPDPWEAK